MRNLFHRSCIICWKKKDIILSHNCILLKISLHNFLNTFSPCKHAGFILEHSLAGFPQFGKKCPQKFTLPHQMGHKNYRPKGKFFFLEKKSLTQSHHWFEGRSINLLWTFIAYYRLNLSPGFFSCPECSKLDAKVFSLGTVCTNKFKYLLWNPLSQKRSP